MNRFEVLTGPADPAEQPISPDQHAEFVTTVEALLPEPIPTIVGPAKIIKAMRSTLPTLPSRQFVAKAAYHLPQRNALVECNKTDETLSVMVTTKNPKAGVTETTIDQYRSEPPGPWHMGERFLVDTETGLPIDPSDDDNVEALLDEVTALAEQCEQEGTLDFTVGDFENVMGILAECGPENHLPDFK